MRGPKCPLLQKSLFSGKVDIEDQNSCGPKCPLLQQHKTWNLIFLQLPPTSALKLGKSKFSHSIRCTIRQKTLSFRVDSKLKERFLH